MNERSAAADAAIPGASPTPSPSTGPVSVLVCAGCGKHNTIRPSPKGSPHCGACGKPLPWLVNATDTTFDVEARDFAGRLKVVKVNVDENPALSQRFDARSIPTLLVIKGGRVVDRIVGAVPKSDLTVRLTPHLLRR